jgi:integrase
MLTNLRRTTLRFGKVGFGSWVAERQRSRFMMLPTLPNGARDGESSH